MKKHILFAACLLAMSGANATYCGPNTVHAGQPEPWYPNRCNEGATPTPTPTAAPTSNTLTGEQRQQQAQLQGQAQRQQAEASARAASISAGGAATSNASGGRSSANAAGAGAGAGASAGAGAGAGSGIVTIQGAEAGSGDTYKSLALALPSVPMTPPSFVAGATVTTTVAACGPLQRVVAEPVYGEHNGLFSNSKVWLGNTEKTEIYLNERGDVQPYTAIGGRWFGHMVVFSTAALGVSSASNLTIGGGGSGGGWGQGGGGASGAMQRLVTSVQLRFCDVGPVVQPVTTVYIERSPIMMPISRPRAKRRIVKTDACIERAVALCREKSAGTLKFGK